MFGARKIINQDCSRGGAFLVSFVYEGRLGSIALLGRVSEGGHPMTGLTIRTAAGFGLAALLAGCASVPETIETEPTSMSYGSCDARMIALSVNSPVNGTNAIYALPNERVLVFEAGMVFDADGAPKAFHPNDPPDSLDFMRNAGRPGNWWSLAVDAYGRPFKQGYNEEEQGYYVSKTALHNPQVSDQSSVERYVNAQEVPYFALPTGPEARRAYEAAGVELGDLGVVYNSRTQTFAYGIYADTSHPNLLGEASIKLADDLGYQDTSPKTNKIVARENLYVVFPGSGQGWPRDVSDIREDSAELLMQWGGPERLAKCASEL